jgi:hypothetical protein
MVTAIYLYSVGEVKAPPADKPSFFATIERDDKITYMIWFFLFCLLWVVAFIMCM